MPGRMLLSAFRLRVRGETRDAEVVPLIVILVVIEANTRRAGSKHRPPYPTIRPVASLVSVVGYLHDLHAVKIACNQRRVRAPHRTPEHVSVYQADFRSERLDVAIQTVRPTPTRNMTVFVPGYNAAVHLVATDRVGADDHAEPHFDLVAADRRRCVDLDRYLRLLIRRPTARKNRRGVTASSVPGHSPRLFRRTVAVNIGFICTPSNRPKTGLKISVLAS